MTDAFDLTPAQWAALRQLLDEGLERPPGQRTAWLSTLAPEFAPYRERLQALLGHAEGATAMALMQTLPKIETAAFAPTPGHEHPSSGTPEQVGPYRLLRELGSGGMASVWLAERTDMLQRRQVALKLPHGAWRRAGLAERMEREREILATLEHPHIARLYDAGLASDGQPYLALEYVQGERIDLHCQHAGLGVPGRLQLFLQVARAVAHAHAQGVVHRDLKPSNILVTGAGEVKLLDFGIAKLLDAAEPGAAAPSELTRLAGPALTPEYAAPEQVTGAPVGPAADVYALGVLLYELLCDQRPYLLPDGQQRHSPAALEEAILRAEVPAPSSRAPAERRRALRGDLDTIVLHALHKQPAQRYPTAAALADDIERHLQHRPLLARPDARWLRAGKFLRRHRLAVATASAVTLALLGGTALAAWQASVARAEASATRRALRIANANVTMADFFASDLAAGRSATELMAQLERAIVMVRSQYGDDDLVRARLLADLGGRLRRNGEWERYRAVSAEAEATARLAGDTELAAQLACRRARDVTQGGDLREGQRIIDSTLPTLEAMTPRPDITLLGCLADASAIARTAGDARQALHTAERIVAIETATGADRGVGHADSLMILARAQNLAGRHADAVRSLRAGIALHEQLGTAGGAGAQHLPALMAGVLTDGGQAGVALEIVDGLLAEHQRRGGEDRTVATTLWQRGMALLALGRLDAAEADFASALAGARASGDRSQVRAAIVGLATTQARAGRLQAAEASLAEALQLYAGPLSQRSFNARLVLFAQAEVALAAGDVARARVAIAAAEQIVQARPGSAGNPAARVLAHLQARLAMAEGRASEALRGSEAALAVAQTEAIDAQASTWVDDARRLVAAARALQATPSR